MPLLYSEAISRTSVAGTGRALDIMSQSPLSHRDSHDVLLQFVKGSQPYDWNTASRT